MRFSPGCLAALALGLCATLVARSAATQSLRNLQPLSIGLDYETTPGCTDRKRFVNGLQKLSPSLRVSPRATPSDPLVAIKFEKRGAVYQGTLRLGATHRQVESEACADTAYALALIAAITLDPDADVARDVSAEEFSEGEPLASDSRPLEAPVPEASAPGASVTGASVPVAAPRPRRPIPVRPQVRSAPVATSPANRKREVAIRVQGFAGREFLGALGWGASLGFGWHGDQSTLLSVWVDLSALQSARTFAGTSVQALQLTLVPSACAHVLGKLQPWALDVCVGAELGAGRVAAQDTASFQTTRTPWHPRGAGFLGLALLHRVADAWRIGASLQAGVGFQSNRYTGTDLEGEETARIVESRFTQRIALQAGYAF
jgi:hypothetical protein